MTHYAYIPEVKEGLVFSNPYCEADVWCQYRKEFHDQDWFMKLDAQSEDGITNFTLYLGRPTFLADTNIQEEGGKAQILYPSRYDIQQVELGMDTAKFFCGSMENWNQFRKEAALYIGADGLFSGLFAFTCKGEEAPSGFLLMGSVDEFMMSEDELFCHFTSSFDAREISRKAYEQQTDKNTIFLKMAISNEVRTARTHVVQMMGKASSAKDEKAPESEC